MVEQKQEWLGETVNASITSTELLAQAEHQLKGKKMNSP